MEKINNEISEMFRQILAIREAILKNSFGVSFLPNLAKIELQLQKLKYMLENPPGKKRGYLVVSTQPMSIEKEPDLYTSGIYLNKNDLKIDLQIIGVTIDENMFKLPLRQPNRR